MSINVVGTNITQTRNLDEANLDLLRELISLVKANQDATSDLIDNITCEVVFGSALEINTTSDQVAEEEGVPDTIKGGEFALLEEYCELKEGYEEYHNPNEFYEMLKIATKLRSVYKLSIVEDEHGCTLEPITDEEIE